MMNTSVIHFFAEQLFYGENHNKNFRLCTFLYISENFMKKFGLDQNLLMILVFCLLKRNRRLLFDPTGNSATERL